MENDVTFIILGATGDLTKRKLIPAIYNLVKNKKLKKFVLVGTARSNIQIKKILSESEKFIEKLDRKAWKKVINSSYYHIVDFYKQEDYKQLKKFVEEIEKKHKLSGNRLFYLATLPQHFETITFNLTKIKLAKKIGGKWVRIVYEKPFGEDLKSAKKINKSISKIFNEKQIYRIDHYLGKELVENISLVRFTNRILEPLWNNKHIESVQIILDEDMGIGNRGPYYDKYGAIKDVVQNHMMQLLALTAMEAPKNLVGEYIRNEKAKLLSKVKIKDLILGQYKGYKKEKGISGKSKTETFAALKLEINNQRWKGVPFFLKTGKNLNKKQTLIIIKFKKVDCLLAKACYSDSNYLIIRIQPDEGISFEINAKLPEKNQVIPVKMDFCHSCLFGPNTSKGYENLFYDIIRGDQSIFIRRDEIENSWTIIDKIKKGKVYPYKKASKGPKQLHTFNKKHNIIWKQ